MEVEATIHPCKWLAEVGGRGEWRDGKEVNMESPDSPHGCPVGDYHAQVGSCERVGSPQVRIGRDWKGWAPGAR